MSWRVKVGGGASSGHTEDKSRPGYRSLVMLLLFLVYAFNFLDRQIISILAIPIKEDLGLTDEQLGLLGGIAFAVLYSTLGVPIAWFADRMSRTWIMTAALTVWSGFTARSVASPRTSPSSSWPASASASARPAVSPRPTPSSPTITRPPNGREPWPSIRWAFRSGAPSA